MFVTVACAGIWNAVFCDDAARSSSWVIYNPIHRLLHLTVHGSRWAGLAWDLLDSHGRVRPAWPGREQGEELLLQLVVLAVCVSSTLVLSVSTYIQDYPSWGLVFGVPCASMAVALCLFLGGTATYHYIPMLEGNSPFVRLGKMFAAKIRPSKHPIELARPSSDPCRWGECKMMLIERKKVEIYADLRFTNHTMKYSSARWSFNVERNWCTGRVRVWVSRAVGSFGDELLRVHNSLCTTSHVVHQTGQHHEHESWASWFSSIPGYILHPNQLLQHHLHPSLRPHPCPNCKNLHWYPLGWQCSKESALDLSTVHAVTAAGEMKSLQLVGKPG